MNEGFLERIGNVILTEGGAVAGALLLVIVIQVMAIKWLMGQLEVERKFTADERARTEQARNNEIIAYKEKAEISKDHLVVITRMDSTLVAVRESIEALIERTRSAHRDVGKQA